MDKNKIKKYIGSVESFIEAFAQARLQHLGADIKTAKGIAEDIAINVIQKNPSPIKHWESLAKQEKKKIAECILMLKELKQSLLKKNNVSLIEGLNEFIQTSTKSLTKAIKSGKTSQLVEAMRNPVEKIELFEKVQLISAQLREAQEKGDSDKLVELKAELDKLNS